MGDISTILRLFEYWVDIYQEPGNTCQIQNEGIKVLKKETYLVAYSQKVQSSIYSRISMQGSALCRAVPDLFLRGF